MNNWRAWPNDAFGVRIFEPSYPRRSRDEPEVRGRCDAKSSGIFRSSGAGTSSPLLPFPLPLPGGEG